MERFVWIACYGMPLNAWNVPSFRAIGSIWGCFIEVDNDTLKETSFAKGKILIATEKSNKIEGQVKLKVNGRIYSVRVEEEDTFRTVSSKDQASNSEAEEEDDYVEDTDDDRDASSKKEENPMDDVEKQRNKCTDDMAKNKEEQGVKGDNSDINGSHQYGLEEEPDHEKPPVQEKTVGEVFIGNTNAGKSSNEESINSIHGPDSIVQDSQSPLIEDCVESANHCSQFQNIEAQQGKNQEQGIKILVDLNPSVVRKNIRSQQFEASLSTEGEDIDGYIIDSREPEQNAMDKELQNTIIPGFNGNAFEAFVANGTELHEELIYTELLLEFLLLNS
ncbi:hypothetical protein RHMOL_Rhmol10G0245900 [Rhododendron molle]|uniref:Uncharacterized protein n=1 Tax=Rhododendron molle TaxID=49168 RepID=A0ACC0M6S7_RHOML|nr:hypothetical protein RHMOL_Rhmol10G0245900 [Rhododendron molle]